MTDPYRSVICCCIQALFFRCFILHRLLPLTVLFLLIPAGRLAGQEPAADTVHLEDVSVSVLPFIAEPALASGSLQSLGLDEGLRAATVQTATLLNQVTGVFLASGTMSTNRLVIRGVGSRTPYSSNRIRTYLDEIPLNTGDGVSSLEDFEAAGMARIDVLKGPSSALYGAGLGGVVVLEPVYPDNNGLGLTLATDHGNYASHRSFLSAGYKQSNMAVSAVLSRSASQGYRQNSRFARNNLFLKTQWFGRRSDLSFLLSLTDLYGQIPSSLNEEDFRSDPTLAAPNWLAVEGHEQYLRLIGGLKLLSRLSPRLTNTLSVFGGSNDPYESRPFNILDERSFNYGLREHLEADLGKLRLKAGLEYFREHHDWQIYETHGGDQGALRSDQQELRHYLNVSFFAQWRPMDRLSLDAGLNLNVLNYELETIFRDDSQDNSGSYRYDPVLSPRLGLNYSFSEHHYLFASAGHGFSAPSLEETLLPEGQVNTALRPETGWNLELGGRGTIGQQRLISYELALYSVLLQDLLVTERVSEEIFTGKNAGAARNSGVELLLRLDRPSGEPGGGPRPDAGSSPEQGFSYTGTLGITLTDNRFVDFIDDGIDHSGNLLPGIPAAILFTNWKFAFRGLSAGIDIRYTGPQWMDDANAQQYEGYVLANLRLAWQRELKTLPLAFELYAGIRNVLDAAYASMILVNAPSFGGAAPRYYYPGMPRQYFAGLILHFKGR